MPFSFKVGIGLLGVSLFLYPLGIQAGNIPIVRVALSLKATQVKLSSSQTFYILLPGGKRFLLEKATIVRTNGGHLLINGKLFKKSSVVVEPGGRNLRLSIDNSHIGESARSWVVRGDIVVTAKGPG